MRSLSIAALAVPFLVMSACATAPTRSPVTFAPAGEYVLEAPEPAEYTAISINETGITTRVGDRVFSGEHWVDDEGRYYMVDEEGPCAGMASVWEYDVQGDRIVLNLVSDECPTRDLGPDYTYRRVSW